MKLSLEQTLMYVEIVEKSVKNKQEHLRELLESAAVYCPYKTGDCLHVPRRAYVYVGKLAEVVDVRLERVYSDQSYTWRIACRVLIKNGGVSQNRVVWHMDLKEEKAK